MTQSTDIMEKDREEIKPERENGTHWLERRSFRIALMSIFSALSLVVGYMLVSIPNIELFTLIIFLSGFILGEKEGAAIGLISSFLFCFFNPMGASALPLLTVQLIYYSLIGFLGGYIKKKMEKQSFYDPLGDLYVFPVLIIFGIIAATMTSAYQFFSQLVDYISYFAMQETFFIYIIPGIPFTAVHIIGNTLGFLFILPGLIQITHNLINSQ